MADQSLQNQQPTEIPGAKPAPAPADDPFASYRLGVQKGSPAKVGDDSEHNNQSGEHAGLTFTDVMQAPTDYSTAHGKYAKELDAYWKSVADLRSEGKYTSDFPPIYTGPPKPADGPRPPKPPSTLPSINDMLAQSKELNRIAFGSNQPDFKVGEISEQAFKDRYAEEMVRIGREHGLTKDQTEQIVERVYRFEDGNWGTAETLSGMSQKLAQADKPGETSVQDSRRNFHPASTAIGYNQLLMMTSTRLLDEHGDEIAQRLTEMAQQDRSHAAQLEDKAKLVRSLHDVVHKEVIDFAHAHPDKNYLDPQGKPLEDLYSDFAKSSDPTSGAGTGRQLAMGLQALNIDGDVGPIIQSIALGDLLSYAQQHGFDQLLDQKAKTMSDGAAAYDALPAAEKAKAMDDLFARIKQPANLDAQAADDFNRDKQSLRARIADLPAGEPAVLPGNLSSTQQHILADILSTRKFGERSGPLSAPERALLDKVWASYLGQPPSDNLRAAAVELQNLAGSGQADLMLRADHADLPTTNFFSRPGYEGNQVTNGRTATELLLQIERLMVRPGGDANNAGALEFVNAFEQVH